jgi:hypothetical protein
MLHLNALIRKAASRCLLIMWGICALYTLICQENVEEFGNRIWYLEHRPINHMTGPKKNSKVSDRETPSENQSLDVHKKKIVITL